MSNHFTYSETKMYFCAHLFEDIISKNFCVENTPEQLSCVMHHLVLL